MLTRALILALAMTIPASAQAVRCPNELPVLFIAQDKSGTMAEPPQPSCTTCPSKWQSATDAVSQLSATFANRFRFGVQMFPHDTTTFNCTTGTTVTPFPATTADIDAAYAAAVPGGGTPIAASLDAAAAYLDSRALSEPAYVLLLTDGLPNCNLTLNENTCAPSQPACATVGACGAKGCLDDAGARAAAARVLAKGYKVYVVGFDSTASANNNKAVLDGIAVSGGTLHSYAATDPATLSAALSAIAYNAATCCKDVCPTGGAAQCTSDGKVKACQMDAALGCTNWVTTACPSKSACVGGACQSCHDACTAGALQCAGSSAQKCVTAANGCTVWTTLDTCTFGEVCQAGSCQSCHAACAEGSSRCDGQNAQRCVADLNGCTAWTTVVNCIYGELCQAGACQSCFLTCNAGEARCEGKLAETCVADAQGCTSWQLRQTCTDFCSGGVCGACGTSCTVGASRCNGASVEACSTDAHGCTTWLSNGPCQPGQFCQAGQCQVCPTSCTVNDAKCATDGGLLFCRAGANGCNDWVATACSDGGTCLEGKCQPKCQDLCTLAAKECDASGNPRRCEKAPSGCTAWMGQASCPAGSACSRGDCLPTCETGEVDTCPEGFVCTAEPDGHFCEAAPPALVVPDDPQTQDPALPARGNEASATRGCGCNAASAPLIAWLAPLALALLRRRRG